MGGIFSTPPAQRCLMSTDSDSSGSSVQPVAISTVVRTRRETHGNRKRTTVRIVKVLHASNSASSVDTVDSSETTDSSESVMSDDSSDASSSSSIGSNITLASSSVVSEPSSVTSLASSTFSGLSSSGSSSSLSSDEWVTRSPPPKVLRRRWPFTTCRRRSSRSAQAEQRADGDDAAQGGEAGPSGSRSDLERKLREMEEALNCVICMCRRRNIAFLCGHAACSRCAAQIDTCHICRRPIAKKIRLH